MLSMEFQIKVCVCVWCVCVVCVCGVCVWGGGGTSFKSIVANCIRVNQFVNLQSTR